MREVDFDESKKKIEVSYGILLALLGLPRYARAFDSEHLMSLKPEAREISAAVRDEVRRELTNILGEIFTNNQCYNPSIWAQLQRHKNVYVRYAATSHMKGKFTKEDMLDHLYYLPSLPEG